MNLYELTENYKTLQMMLDNGEDEQAIYDTLSMIDESITDKAENIGCFIRNLEAENEGLKAEEQRFTDRRKRNERLIDRLKGNLTDNLLKVDKRTLKTDHFAYSFRKSTVVNVLDESAIPAEYIKEKVTKSVDKTALKKALAEGNAIDGAVLEVRENIQIK